jgi:hypothetical protein
VIEKVENWKNYSLDNLQEESGGVIYAEIWQPVNDPIFRDSFLVSTFGRIKSLHNNKIRRQWQENGAYLRITLTNKKYSKPFYCHILIARTFIPNPNNLPQVNHIKGIKTDNRVWMLEWSTSKDNILHAFQLGLSKKGEDHGLSKLTNDQVFDIFTSKEKRPELIKKYGVSTETIKSIKLGKTWSHLTNKKYEKAENTSRRGLSNKDILEIYLSTEKPGILSKRYGVSTISIFNIKSRKNFSPLTHGIAAGQWNKNKITHDSALQ